MCIKQKYRAKYYTVRIKHTNIYFNWLFNPLNMPTNYNYVYLTFNCISMIHHIANKLLTLKFTKNV